METVVLVAKLKLKNITELDVVELDNAITAYTNALNYVSKYVAKTNYMVSHMLIFRKKFIMI